MSYAGRPATAATDAVRAARDFVLENTYDYERLRAEFAWPVLDEFNFGTDWFDVVAGEHPDRVAVRIVEDDLSMAQWTYGELAERSDRVAHWLVGLGLRPGDRMIVMLHNTIELWETLLALTKVGGVAIPTSTLLAADDLAWRVATAGARFTISAADLAPRFAQVPDGVRDALAHGVKVTGCTVFEIDAGVDTGRIIAQEPVSVLPGDTEATLHERIKIVERQLLVDTVNTLAATTERHP